MGSVDLETIQLAIALGKIAWKAIQLGIEVWDLIN